MAAPRHRIAAGLARIWRDLATVGTVWKPNMDNDPTIPSQLGPMNTIPSALGPVGPANRAARPAVVSPVLKFVLVVSAMALLAYIAR